MRAVVIGGGVAGPAAALGLLDAGIEVTVLERRAGPDAQAGSYLTLAPNGLAALDALGVRGMVADAGFPTRANAMFGATGRHLGTLGLGPALDDGAVGLTLKRAHLAAVLTEQAQHGGADVRWGVRVRRVVTTSNGVVAELAIGERITADVAVAADGVHSRTRRGLDPSAPTARYVGLTNFGGVTDAADVTVDLQAERWHFVFGRRCFFGAHPTPAGDVVWFVNVPEPEIPSDVRERTSSQAWLSRLGELVADDAGPAAALVGAGRLELAGDNTYDLAHVPVWHDDRTVLVGDAAHAPAPSSGQGASLALEDAVVLARCLREAAETGAALTAYEAARRDRVERVVKAGARTSSAKVPGPVGRRIMEAGMRFAFRHVLTEKRTAWMGGYRVAAADTVREGDR
ncbi:Rossmann-fold NAD(P)-binding domain-containing protein [Jatrophihabitans fulvus]